MYFNDKYMQNGEYMAVYCKNKGKRTVYLPCGTEHTIETSDYKTVIFDLETGEKL